MVTRRSLTENIKNSEKKRLNICIDWLLCIWVNCQAFVLTAQEACDIWVFIDLSLSCLSEGLWWNIEPYIKPIARATYKQWMELINSLLLWQEVGLTIRKEPNLMNDEWVLLSIGWIPNSCKNPFQKKTYFRGFFLSRYIIQYIYGSFVPFYLKLGISFLNIE